MSDDNVDLIFFDNFVKRIRAHIDKETKRADIAEAKFAIVKEALEDYDAYTNCDGDCGLPILNYNFGHHYEYECRHCDTHNRWCGKNFCDQFVWLCDECDQGICEKHSKICNECGARYCSLDTLKCLEQHECDKYDKNAIKMRQNHGAGKFRTFFRDNSF